MKNIISVLIGLLLTIFCFGQAKKNRSLTIGDTVPEMEISNLVNHSSTTVRLSDFRGKLLIIDFWATWCSPCIAAFPKMHSLSEKFKNNIQILAVTEESKAVVTSFFDKIKKTKTIPVPVSVTDDKKLSQLFFHATIPHYVWIDGTGKIIAITDAEDVNEDNISSYLRNGQFNFSLKEDNPGLVAGKPMYFNYTMFYFKNGIESTKQLDTSRLTIHSVLTKYVDGVASGGQFAPDDYIFRGNSSILQLYKTALYGSAIRILNSSPSVLIVDIPDSILRSHITTVGISGKEIVSSRLEILAWIKENAYCYELKVPSSLIAKKYPIMLDQLNLYFGALYGIEGVIENRSNKYLALVRTSTEDKIRANEKVPQVKQVNSFYLKIQNYPAKTLVNSLVLPLQLQPMIEDETNYSGNISIEVNCRLADLKALNKELSRYDLQLVEKEKPMNVGIIRMKK